MKNIIRCTILAISLLLIGCGYRFAASSDMPRTVSIHFVENDRTGELTSALIKEISSSGVLSYRSSGGNLLLKVKLLDFSDENIGFRYDRNEQGEIVKSLVPSEARSSMIAEVMLVDACSQGIIFGPEKVFAHLDVDFDDRVGNAGIFSLGQFTDRDTALEISTTPLSYLLARKIADLLAMRVLIGT